ncbi:MAG: LacI family DNA-binding transcriptional regulator [Verrucomicrobiae bacterium]|nr:LacI family DNA-binding transcriptional regulator [Verrucomicrobiae bacterium]
MKARSPKSSVTMEDIARTTRLSKMTVSRALTGNGYVSDKTRQRVLAAASQLNYEFHALASHLSRNRTGLVAMVTSFEGLVGSHYFGRIVEGVQAAFNPFNYHMMLIDSRSENFDDGEKCARLYHQRRVDGLIVVAPDAGEKYVATFRDLSVPLIFIGHTPPNSDVSCVQVDNTGGIGKAVAHLIQLGHAQIAFLAGPSDVTDAAEREEGFRAAMKKANLPVLEEWILRGKFHTRTSFDVCVAALSKKRRPTALVCANDLMAFGAVDAARSLGLSVPGDLSIAGFDDVREALPASLTTVKQPIFQLGKAAGDFVLKEVYEPEHRRVVRERLATQLIVRGSTSAPAPKK